MFMFIKQIKTDHKHKETMCGSVCKSTGAHTPIDCACIGVRVHARAHMMLKQWLMASPRSGCSDDGYNNCDRRVDVTFLD